LEETGSEVRLMTKIPDLINDYLSDYDIEYRIHASQRMFRRNIHEDDVEAVLKNGDIIEQYDDDFPLPSLLINGQTSKNRPLHVVAAINHTEKIVIVITAYEPDISRWSSDFSGRRK
jgi:hypothetical protein